MSNGFDIFTGTVTGIFWLLVFGFIIFAVLRFAGQQDDLERQLKAFLAERGWSYRPLAPELARRWSGPPFRGAEGGSSKAISGQIEGLPFTAFRYTWTTGSGDSQVTHRNVVVAIQLPVSLPLLWIFPQTTAHKLANPLGSHDITFESPDFNEAFMVTADNDRYAYSVVYPPMMEFLLGSPARVEPIRIEGSHAITWINADLTPHTLVAAATLLSRFVARIPSHVYDQHATTAATGYAGSVSGLRPETTGTDLMRGGFALVWGFFWIGMSSVMTLVGYWAVTKMGAEWYYLAGPAAFVVIGLIVVISMLVPTIKGAWAIRQNKRQRARASS